MKTGICKLVVLLIVVALCSVGKNQVMAEDTIKGVKAHGVIHNIAEDRRIEKIGGLYEPEGVDKYMKRHFDKINERIRSLEQQLDKLVASIEVIKKEVKKPSE
jgi:hypothetical protein